MNNACPLDDVIAVSSSKTEVTPHPEAVTNSDPHTEVILTSIFVEELQKIWLEIKSINNKFNEVNEGERNNVCNFIQQENLRSL